MRPVILSCVLCLPGLLLPTPARAAEPTIYRPDPLAVQRYGPAYRYPQAGWIVLHIEGAPYERGYQHGRLLAPEIAAHVRCFATTTSPKAPAEGWKLLRVLVDALFLRRYEKEYLEEMKGIADGATAAGARFDSRALDLIDIAALNSWAEVETLDGALDATPNGLEGIRFPKPDFKAMARPKAEHCSAFAATGPATADGKIVFGHITMFSLYPSNLYNIWLDVKPAKGHRVLMQTYPGGIQSGMDYYMNDAGLLVCETTIRQTRFDIKGTALASRIRQALQYADSIDRAVEILKAGNNGLYTNEWLLADVKTNEIAMFELGTHKTRLWRSSKNEWFGGTEGFYWGCNNTKDLDVRLETVASVEGRPANMVFRPSERDKTWIKLYQEHKGKIDAGFGKRAFTTPPVAAYHSLDAKFTTSALAKDLKTWAIFGPPLGRTWQPTEEERRLYSEIRPLVSNPWTILHPQSPPRVEANGIVVVDLKAPLEAAGKEEAEEKNPPVITAAWHGTILPKGDADIWLAVAFAEYEKIVALENGLRERSRTKELSKADRDRLAVELFAHRSNYLTAARATEDVPLRQIKADPTRDEWYRIASGKGVLLLHDLRLLLGDEFFQKAMDKFGSRNAGKAVALSDFVEHLSLQHGRPLEAPFLDFFESWLNKGLPRVQIRKVVVAPSSANGYETRVELFRTSRWSVDTTLEISVETASGEVTKQRTVKAGDSTTVVLESSERPLRVIVDKYGLSAKANGSVFSVLSFHSELDRSLIVYGTADEISTNREAAEALQRAIVERGSNITVPIKSDREVTDDDLKDRHLLLIGRPDSNVLVQRFRDALPMTFGSRSFVVRGETYAHPGSAVIVVGENPLNRRYSIVVIAGLEGASTLQAAPRLLQRGQRLGDVLVLPNGERPRTMVLPAKELVYEVNGK